MELAREIFARPNVEPASHTYSHPFQWGFFRNYDPASEKPFRAIYDARGQDRYQGGDPDEKSMQAARAAGLHTGYRIPPAYGDKPRSEEHTSELQSLMRSPYAVFSLKTTISVRHNTSTRSE